MGCAHGSSQQARSEDVFLDAGTGAMAPGVRQAHGVHGVWHLAEVGTASMMQVRFAEHVASTLAAWIRPARVRSRQRSLFGLRWTHLDPRGGVRRWMGPSALGRIATI